MSPARRSLIVAGVAVAATVAGGAAGIFLLRRRSYEAGVLLLSASFPDVSGRRRKLSDWQGRPLLCNFWASWCAPCREELPLLDATWRENAGKKLQVVGIAIDNQPNVTKYLKSVQIGYPVLVAEGSAISLMQQLGNHGGALPFTVMLDAAGRLRQSKLGAYSAPELQSDLTALLR